MSLEHLSSTIKHAMRFHPSPPETLPHCVWVTFNNLGHFKWIVPGSKWLNLCVNEVPPRGANQSTLQHLLSRIRWFCPIQREARQYDGKHTCGNGRWAKTLERNSVKPQPMPKSIGKPGRGLISSILASLKDPRWGDRLLFPNLLHTAHNSEESVIIPPPYHPFNLKS